LLLAFERPNRIKSFPVHAEVVLTPESAKMNAAEGNSPSYTLRVTFSYDGPKLEIVSVQRVAMRTPAPAATAPQVNQTGYWLEVRDGNGVLLYHRPIHDPTRRHIESFGDAPGKPMRRHPATDTKGEFEVLVPDLPGAQTFRLHGPGESAAKTAGAPAPSSGLSEHSFDDLRRRSGLDSAQEGKQ
jgi:hypothetical protein